MSFKNDKLPKMITMQINELEYSRTKTDKLIAQFSCSLMSNVKWVKLLKCLTSIENILCDFSVKIVWDDSIRHFRLDETVQYQLDYYDTSLESMISGNPKGFYDYREIEWLTIEGSSAQIKKVKNAMKSVGHFEFTDHEHLLKIFAYK